MARRKSKSNDVKLFAEEIATAAPHMFSAAHAHQRASTWCMEKPTEDLPDIESIHFQLVSFELLLLSIEQSLRLILLLQFSISKSTHNIHRLYKIIQNRCGRDMRIRNDLIERANDIAQEAAQTWNVNIRAFDESDVVSLLKMHDTSYSIFRYFQLNREAKLDRRKWQMSPLDFHTMNFFAMALLNFNREEMLHRMIGLPAFRVDAGAEIPDYVSDFRERVQAEREATERGS